MSEAKLAMSQNHLHLLLHIKHRCLPTMTRITAYWGVVNSHCSVPSSPIKHIITLPIIDHDHPPSLAKKNYIFLPTPNSQQDLVILVGMVMVHLRKETWRYPGLLCLGREDCEDRANRAIGLDVGIAWRAPCVQSDHVLHPCFTGAVTSAVTLWSWQFANWKDTPSFDEKKLTKIPVQWILITSTHRPMGAKKIRSWTSQISNISSDVV